MTTRLILCLSLGLLAAGCASSNNPPAANSSDATLRSPNNPADLRASAAYGGTSPGAQGPGMIGSGPR